MVVIAQGLSILPVTTESEALSIVRVGQANRETAAHQLNHASSRWENIDASNSKTAHNAQTCTCTSGKWRDEGVEFT